MRRAMPARRRRARWAPGSRLRASSTKRRIAAEMPFGWSSSQSQWRGSNDISRPTTPSFGRRGPDARPLENVIERSAEVEVDLLTADILEYQDTIVITVGILLDLRQDAVSISGGYAPSSGEGGVHDLLVIRVRHDENYIQVK